MLADLRAALRPSAPPKPAVSDTTIKSKSAAFDQTLPLSPQETFAPQGEPVPASTKRPAAPQQARPEPSGPSREPEAHPAPKPAPVRPPASAAGAGPKPGGSTAKTLAISGGLLLVMVVIIVLVVRLVKKPSAITPPPPGADLSQKSPAAGGISPQVKAQAEQLVLQAKGDLTANPTNAQKLLEQAVALDPKNFEAQFQLARLFTMRKNYPAAIQHYQEALSLNNQVPEIPFNLGFIYLNQGDYDLAIRYYESCRALSPPYQDEVLTNLGIAYLKKNNPAQAQLFFKQAIGLNPNNTLARNYLQAQPAPGSTPAAPSAPAAVDPKAQAAALIAQAKGLLQTNAAKAQGLLEQASQLDSGNYEAPYQLGRLFTFQKNYSQAVQHYQTALRLNPRIPEVHFNLGYILMTQGQYDQAIKYFDSCRALSPPFQDEVLTNLGISFLKKNNPVQAQTYFREALKINPQNSLARSYLKNLGG
jgi:serine/threonine-protein kinase